MGGYPEGPPSQGEGPVLNWYFSVAMPVVVIAAASRATSFTLEGLYSKALGLIACTFLYLAMRVEKGRQFGLKGLSHLGVVASLLIGLGILALPTTSIPLHLVIFSICFGYWIFQVCRGD